MEPEVELDFFDLIKDFNEMGIKYLIIGRRAVVLYGAPVLTADYDFWIDSSERARVLSYFAKKGGSLSDAEDSIKPTIQVYAGPRKIDLFFHHLWGALRERVQFIRHPTAELYLCPCFRGYAVFEFFNVGFVDATFVKKGLPLPCDSL